MLANPEPEVDPATARRHAGLVATGRSDEPNQIDNVLVFPGLSSGLLNAGAKRTTEAAELAAAPSLVAVVEESELSVAYIVPTVFNPPSCQRSPERSSAPPRRTTDRAGARQVGRVSDVRDAPGVLQVQDREGTR